MKNLFLLSCLICGIFSASAQDIEAPKDPNDGKFNGKRVYVGGGGGLMLGNPGYVQASPIVGYRLTDKASVGVGADLLYYYGTGWSRLFYGGNTFGRYQVASNAFLHAEYSVINTEIISGQREWVRTGLIGGGYQPSPHFFIMALYIINYDPNRTPYATLPNLPIVVRVGFTF